MEKIIIDTKIFLATKFNILYYFYKKLGIRLFLTLLFNILMVVMDGFGLTLFVPLLKIADSAGKVVERPDKLTMAVKNFFEALHLPLTVPVVLAFIVVIFCLKGIFAYLTTVFQGITMAHFSRGMRREKIRELNGLSYKAFVQSDFGQLQNTVTGEISRVEGSAYQYIDTLKNILIVLVYLGLSVATDYKFSLMVIAMGVLFNFVYKFFYKKTKERSAQVTAIGHDINSNIMQSLYNFKYLKATNIIEKYRLKTEKIIDDVLHVQISISKINAFIQAIREPMMMIIVSLVILVELTYFKVSIGSIIVILLFFYRAMANLLSLQTSWNNFLATSGALENMRSFERFLDTHQEMKGGTIVPGKITALEFKNAGLYFDSFKVLKDISLSIRGKQTVAFVGESGSGKSTLVNMVCALYAPDEGQFLVNDSEIHDVNIAAYRSRIGYISQEPTVFTGTIFENVTLWEPKTPENLQKFWEAIRKSNLKAFIDSLPGQEDALLGNSGINLSGGQKQRISIARELYKDIDILVMDEATSALDSETEHEVQKSIDSLEGELIILIIAHRLSTVMKADNIVVMKAGHIEATGTFTELKHKSEYFNKLASLQGL